MPKRTFVSKKKLSGTRCTYRAWKDWEEGDYLIGTFKGTKTDNYDKPNYLVQVEEAEFANKKESKKLIGQVIGLNSAGSLDKAMENVVEGDMVQVLYNGMGQIEKGKYAGKEAHAIEVDLVEEEGAKTNDKRNEEDDADLDDDNQTDSSDDDAESDDSDSEDEEDDL